MENKGLAFLVLNFLIPLFCSISSDANMLMGTREAGPHLPCKALHLGVREEMDTGGEGERAHRVAGSVKCLAGVCIQYIHMYTYTYL